MVVEHGVHHGGLAVILSVLPVVLPVVDLVVDGTCAKGAVRLAHKMSDRKDDGLKSCPIAHSTPSCIRTVCAQP